MCRKLKLTYKDAERVLIVQQHTESVGNICYPTGEFDLVNTFIESPRVYIVLLITCRNQAHCLQRSNFVGEVSIDRPDRPDRLEEHLSPYRTSCKSHMVQLINDD